MEVGQAPDGMGRFSVLEVTERCQVEGEFFGNPQYSETTKSCSPFKPLTSMRQMSTIRLLAQWYGQDRADYIKARLAILPSIMTTLNVHQLKGIRESLLQSARDAPKDLKGIPKV
jgi:hypothetical protein